MKGIVYRDVPLRLTVKNGSGIKQKIEPSHFYFILEEVRYV